MKRVAVIRKGDGVQLGTMNASVGMKLAYDGCEGREIAKVNEKTVTLDNGFRSEGIVCVSLLEARRFGWPKIEGCNLFKVK